jgi:2-C-methyl-D-erythritol 4-phosphate cytidylyltransferase
MGFEYCVLPDGTIFKLTCPEDFQCAREIIRDEVGNDIDSSSESG